MKCGIVYVELLKVEIRKENHKYLAFSWQYLFLSFPVLRSCIYVYLCTLDNIHKLYEFT